MREEGNDSGKDQFAYIYRTSESLSLQAYEKDPSTAQTLDLRLSVLKQLLPNFIWNGWDALVKRPELLHKGWQQTGLLRAFDLDFQNQANRAHAKGHIFPRGTKGEEVVPVVGENEAHDGLNGYDIFDTSCLELPPARKRKAKGRPAHKVSDTQPKKRGRPKGSKNNKPAGGRHSTKSKAPARKSRNQASSSEGSSASGEEEDGGEMELGSEGEESDGGTGNSDDEPLNVRI
jgi:hypothetical protein